MKNLWVLYSYIWTFQEQSVDPNCFTSVTTSAVETPNAIAFLQIDPAHLNVWEAFGGLWMISCEENDIWVGEVWVFSFELLYDEVCG